MTAPPARSHITSVRAPPQLSFPSNNDWGEDDAWDSGSDSENVAVIPSRSLPLSTSSRGIADPKTPRPAPIPISPRKNSIGHSSASRYNHRSSTSSNSIERSSASIGNLSFSFTHVQAPSPSSYPIPTVLSTHVEDIDWQERDEKERAGWTIVSSDIAPVRPPRHASEADDTDIDGDMIVGDLESDIFNQDDSDEEAIKEGKDAIKPDVEELVKDPLYALWSQRTRSPTLSKKGTSRRSSSAGPSTYRAHKGSSLARGRSLRTSRRYEKVVECITRPDVNIADLRKIAWSGLPDELRPIAWPLLLGYLPLPQSSRLQTLIRKREEYASLVRLTFARGKDGLDQQIWHQIEIDVPRTRPGVRLWMEGGTQRSLERILYVWAIRHPASGYVQGINDLVTPFYQVFLSAYIDCDPEQFDPSYLPEDILNAVEADSFWCLSRLLDGIQDNYISQQPGIQRSVRRMQDLVGRIDAPLAAHLEAEGVEFMQFAFRWMNCLLMREISVKNTIRMWDTYLAEGTDAFSQFHLYVCSAFLVKWSEKLRSMDFQGIIMFLQSLPTQDWSDHEIEMLLSEAFVLSSVWQNAQSHFGASSIVSIGR